MKIFFFTYAETLQETALTLVDGNNIADDSLAELDELVTGDMMTTLAKIVTGQQENLRVASLRDAFRQANSELQHNLSYIGGIGGYDKQPMLAVSVPVDEPALVEVTAVSPTPVSGKLTLLTLLRG